MEINEPLVSIVVPSYNHSRFVTKCIDSIFEQTYTNFELFVFDDGSTDDSVYVLSKLQEKFKFYLEIQKNIGVSNTLNNGFKNFAQGKYLTFCASDDYWVPNKLELQVKFMESNPKYAMVYGKAHFIDEADCIIIKHNLDAEAKYKGGHIFEDLILQKFHPPVNYLIRANVLKDVGYYTAGVWAEDFDMNLKIASKYPIGFINEYLMYYRILDKHINKKIDFNTVNSHRQSIELYKNAASYRKAIKMWGFRNFIWYAKYKETKLYAFKNMLHSISFFYTYTFLKSLIRLIILWK